MLVNLRWSMILPAKMSLFSNSRRWQFRTCGLWENQRQVQQSRGTLVYGEDRGSWEGLLERKSIGEKQELKVRMVSHWWSCWRGLFLVGDAMFLSPCWPVMTLTEGSVIGSSSSNCCWVEGPPLLAPDSTVARLAFINIHNAMAFLWGKWGKMCLGLRPEPW